MKFRAIKENHLFGKAYAKGKRAVTSALVVYVLPDYCKTPDKVCYSALYRRFYVSSVTTNHRR